MVVKEQANQENWCLCEADQLVSRGQKKHISYPRWSKKHFAKTSLHADTPFNSIPSTLPTTPLEDFYLMSP
ncbi:hypothetical protein PRUPE_6G301300 [Prunus persica]|uniref:Uncharacterized protein n=1 Tax=Prunus persica TaxID=3760 RepID=A0A251NXQ3_PRUPE|nr:hypothetical protein PRUPE_6G301300 [Prunus persica]